MNALVALGWVGSACFFARGIVQWWASERARRVECPTVYWWLSLLGSVLVGVYALWRREPVLLAGLLLNSFFYTRNLQLVRGAERLPPAITALVVLLGLPLLVVPATGELASQWEIAPDWLFLAALGQVLWNSRFALQWWAAERSGESRLPVSFWYVSLCGNCLLLAYALHLRDAVFVANFALGPLAQLRNLHLARRRLTPPVQ